MNDYDIIKEKEILAKEKVKDFDFSISKEDSEAIFLKKSDVDEKTAAKLGDLALMDDDGQVVASIEADKKVIAKKLEAAKIIDAKIMDAKFEEKIDDMDFSADTLDSEADSMNFEANDEFLWSEAEELEVEDLSYQSEGGSWFQDVADSAYETGVVVGKMVASEIY